MTGQSESSYFYSMHRGKFILCLKYFLKKDIQFRVFRLTVAYSLLHNEFLGIMSDKYNSEDLRNKKTTIIWRQHLPMQRNLGGQIGVVVQNLDTRNTYTVTKNAKKVIKYFKCDPNLWLCRSRHTYHVTEKNIKE